MHRPALLTAPALLTGIALALVPFASMAQTPAPALPPTAPAGQQEMVKMMQMAAHNQLGVLEYCQSQGSVGPDVIALQQRIMGMMPPSTDAALDAAEAEGKTGTVEFAGNKVALAEAAKSRSTTVDAMCKQMGSMLEAQAANLPK